MRSLSFRDKNRASGLVKAIHKLIDKPLKIVHVCGTHEITITQHGLRSLLPSQIEVLEGPGCPVCVTPAGDIDEAIALAKRGVIVATFGDMLRVPGSRGSLEEARGLGADVRVVYSVLDAVRLAERTKGEVVFFGIGFETTAPMTAAVLLEGPPQNFSVLLSNKLIPPAMEALMADKENQIKGFIAPGHVSTIIGVKPYEELSQRHKIPIVIGGFEPLDVLYAIALIARQLKFGSPRVENGYPRSVTYEGNLRAKELMEKVFEVTDASWRGIGVIPNSGLKLRKAFLRWDVREKFDIKVESKGTEHPGCRCSQIIMAKATPNQCPLFAKACTPRSPYGPCMVGEEAMCNIWHRYGGRSLV
jgi:hydrogenase expression/formation protein HypD